MRLQYYEGTLQLRNPSEEVLSYVENAIKQDGKVWIAKTTKLPNGYDLQLSSQAFLKQVGRKLKIIFGGQLVESMTETGYNKHGKAQVRLSILFRQYPFKKGSSVVYKGEEYTIIEIAHKVRIKSKENGKSITVGYDEIKLKSD
jgi:NMD protein affecting ribosome stability and mRNA decay